MLKKIAVEDLIQGMYLQGLCGSWTQHPFWRSKFVIKDPGDIRLIVESGIKEVWIDIEKGLDVATPPEPVATAVVEEARPAAAPRVEQPRRVSTREEMQRASRICASAKDSVASMLHEVRMGKAISDAVANEVVEEISASVLRNPGALISLARLKTADDYTYMHSVAVCALMVALARSLDLDAEQTHYAGKAGLLHDVGKMMVPMAVLNKPGKLTDEEFGIVKSHPQRGYDLLLESGTVGEAALDVCLHHHEKMDGSGYPHRLKGEQISLLARMGAVCDVYDAITSNRPYKAGWDPAESIRKMNEWANGHFDARVFQSFVKSIGIYPVGSLVRLSSGRLGVVVEQSAKSLLTPCVKVFFSTRSEAYVSPELIDLSRGGSAEKIVGAEDASKWGIKNLERLWVS